MKLGMLLGLVVLVAPSLLGAVSAQPAAVGFTGDKTSWHGFDRYDFLMDEAQCTLRPIKAAPDEKNGIKGQVKGQLRCVVVVPKQAAAGMPWSWRGYYFDHEPQVEIELLKRGLHIGYIQIDTGKHWEAWYDFLTGQHGLSKKLPMKSTQGGCEPCCRSDSASTG